MKNVSPGETLGKGCINLYESYPKLKTSHLVRHGEEEGLFIIEIRLKNENVSPGETLVKGMFMNPT